jgi:hypothetical protein
MDDSEDYDREGCLQRAERCEQLAGQYPAYRAVFLSNAAEWRKRAEYYALAFSKDASKARPRAGLFLPLGADQPLVNMCSVRSK